jgi:hypothetical protein
MQNVLIALMVAEDDHELPPHVLAQMSMCEGCGE